MGIVDSQCLSGDPYVAAALAGAATSTLKLATAVTNTATRHPAVAATAAASVQAETGGRFVLGIGRGDSALAYLGLAPAPPAQFERHLERLQGVPAPRRGGLRPRRPMPSTACARRRRCTWTASRR